MLQFSKIELNLIGIKILYCFELFKLISIIDSPATFTNFMIYETDKLFSQLLMPFCFTIKRFYLSISYQ